eukprot:11460757-Prorocentrum_lima.AAC.1
MVNDDADPPMVTLRIITQGFMDISAESADTLRRHNVAAAPTGKRIIYKNMLWFRTGMDRGASRASCSSSTV